MDAAEKVAIATTVACADRWKLPLMGVLTNHGHDHECDKVLSDNVMPCDCWWQDVWNALKGMEDVADLGRAQLQEVGDEPEDAR